MEKKSEYKGKLCSSSKKKKTRVCRHIIAMNNPFPPRPILPVNKTCTEWNCCTVTMNVLFLTPVSSSIVSFLFLFHSMFVLCYCYYCCCSFLLLRSPSLFLAPHFFLFLKLFDKLNVYSLGACQLISNGFFCKKRLVQIISTYVNNKKKKRTQQKTTIRIFKLFQILIKKFSKLFHE